MLGSCSFQQFFCQKLVPEVDIPGAQEGDSGHHTPRPLQRMYDQELINTNKHAFGSEGKLKELGETQRREGGL